MQKFLNTELGRSLVEMLGVLAIVGVLSIAAMAGYSYAITKWKAGEVLSDLHTRAIEYTRQMAMQKKFAPDFVFENFDLGDENSLGNPVAGYPLFDDPTFFEIEVRGVSSEVCRQIIRDKSAPIIDVAVNNGDYGAEEAECDMEMPSDLVTMTFLFFKTLEDVEGSVFEGSGTYFEESGTYTETAYEETPECPEGERMVGYDDENGHYKMACCPSDGGGYAWAEEKCCASAEYSNGGHCCPFNNYKGGWGENVNRCCTTSEKSSDAYDTEGKRQYYCCPSDSPGWGVNVNRCCDAAQGEKRYGDYDSNNQWNYFCCPTGQTWDSTTERCVGGEANQCATNDDCLANEFCNLKNATSCTVKPTTGVCQPATVSHTKTINGVTYKRSSDDMNFWSAENFCARIGGSMVSVSDFKCGYDFVTNKKTGFCNKDTSTSSSGTLSDTMKEFMSGLGSNYVWTDDDYNACGYGVYLYSGYVRDFYRYNTNGYALCRVGGA